MVIRDLLVRIGVDGRGAESELSSVDNTVHKVRRGFQALGAAIAAIGAAQTVRGIINLLDSVQRLQSQIGASTGNFQTAGAVFDALAQHANTTRTSVDAYVDSWAKMNQGIKGFGGTADDTTKFVDTLSAAFTVNGTAAESANAALFQLGQTMQSGVVQGEEMNSFLDAQGTLAKEVMEAIGGTVTGYKKMQQAGKVTAKMLMDSVNAQHEKWLALLEKTPMTVANTWTIITNDVRVGARRINEQMSIIPRLAKAIMTAWEMLRKGTTRLMNALGGTEQAFYHFGNMLKAVGAILAAGALYKGLMMLLSPLGLLLIGLLLVTLAWDDVATWMDGGDSLIGRWLGSWKDVKPVFDDAGKAIKAFKDESIKELQEFYDWLEKVADFLTKFQNSANTLRGMVGLAPTKGFSEGGGTEGGQGPGSDNALTRIYNGLGFGSADQWLSDTFGWGKSSNPKSSAPTPGGAAMAIPGDNVVNNNQRINVTVQVPDASQAEQAGRNFTKGMADQFNAPAGFRSGSQILSTMSDTF